MMVSQAKDPTGYLYNGSWKSYGESKCRVLVFINMIANATVILKFNWSVCHLLCLRYEMQDLHVSETLPKMVALSETYMQIYEQQTWCWWVGVSFIIDAKGFHSHSQANTLLSIQGLTNMVSGTYKCWKKRRKWDPFEMAVLADSRVGVSIGNFWKVILLLICVFY